MERLYYEIVEIMLRYCSDNVRKRGKKGISSICSLNFSTNSDQNLVVSVSVSFMRLHELESRSRIRDRLALSLGLGLVYETKVQ